MFVYFCIYHSMQRFKLGMADKIADIDNSINAIGTKVTDIDSSLDKNINSFSYAKNEWQTWQTCIKHVKYDEDLWCVIRCWIKRRNLVIL